MTISKELAGWLFVFGLLLLTALDAKAEQLKISGTITPVTERTDGTLLESVAYTITYRLDDGEEYSLVSIHDGLTFSETFEVGAGELEIITRAYGERDQASAPFIITKTIDGFIYPPKMPGLDIILECVADCIVDESTPILRSSN